MDDFLLFALLGGAATALFTAPVGCFVVWRRMAFFSDALAHSTILGIAIGLMAGLPMMAGMLGVAVLVALLMLWLERTAFLPQDALLGILTNVLLALGVIAVSLAQVSQVQIYDYLFGDILTITEDDLLLLGGMAVVVPVLLAWQWNKLLLVTMHPDLAAAEGVKVTEARLFFMLLMTVVVAAGVHFMGVLLVSALLIIPAASARSFSHSPVGMAVGSAIVSLMAVAVGIKAAFQYDLPVSPAIAATAGVFFMASLLVRGLRGRGAAL